jgi:branched-chain amino acid aminotransferase
MKESVSFNGEIIEPEQVRLGISAQALHGKGVFTTIAVRAGRLFLWEKHWRRIKINAEKLNIDLTEFSDTITRAAVDELINKNNVENGRVRVTFFDTSSSKIWPIESTDNTSLLIMTGDLRPVPANFRVTISPFPVNSRSPLAGVKSCNYLEQILALDETNGRGFHEAIRVNENGKVTSGCMANVFWLKDDVLFTPTLATGCLAGTTREFVLENLDCRKVEALIEELDTADAIYLTSAGLGVTSVAEFDSHRFSPTDHPITRLLPVMR